jgi:sarcosine oxidase subunit alpha
MSRRAGLLGGDRAQLVGLKPVGDVKQLSAGAHLFESDAEPVRVNGQGYITSVGFSPTLGSMLALGFLDRGRARHGEVIRMVDHMRGLDAQVEVCDPVFFDPEGGRVRG